MGPSPSTLQPSPAPTPGHPSVCSSGHRPWVPHSQGGALLSWPETTPPQGAPASSFTGPLATAYQPSPHLLGAGAGLWQRLRRAKPGLTGKARISEKGPKPCL